MLLFFTIFSILLFNSQGEFCAVVWDVESGGQGQGKVLFRPLSEEPTASICWLDAHVLVVGTSISWVRMYDIRVNNTHVQGSGGSGTGGQTSQTGTGAGMGPTGGGQGGEIMSIMAHAATRPRKVKGIRCDQMQQHVIATFSDSAGEPVKIW